MKTRDAFKSKLTTFALYCLSFFFIIVGLVFSIYWLMWAYYMMFIMYTGIMMIGFGGFLLFYLYMTRFAYYNKP